MKNINSIKPDANLSHNAFDRSRRDVYSLKPAMLVPTFCEDTIPDSRYEISDLSIIRTQPIQSAPFARMTRHTEYYYVPYSQIYRDFEKIYYERGENQRNVGNSLSVSQATHVPMFDLSTVVLKLASEYLMLRIVDGVRATCGSSSELAYVLTFMQNVASESNDLQVGPLVDIHGRWCVEDSLRILDMLGYANYLPTFKVCFAHCLFTLHAADPVREFDSRCSDIKDLIVTNNGSSQGDHITQLNSLYNELNSSFVNALQDTMPGITNRYVSVFRLAAYLKVWSDMYRNSQYDVNVNYAYYFNYDYAVTNDLAIVPVNKIIELLKPRYRQWKKDLFTGTFPSAQFGETAIADLNNPSRILSAATASISDASVGVRTNGSSSNFGELLLRGSSNNIISGSNRWNIESSVSAVAMRQALAFQRYKETLLRAGNRLTALQRAMFGDSSRFIENNYVDFLGAWSSTIDFNTVAATAESDSQNVGQLSSNGVSTSSKNGITFHSHDFGIILAMTYILPEAEYEAFGLDPQLRKTEAFDFYKSHFQNLGLSEIFNFDFNILDSNGHSGYTDSVLGYLMRYWEYKCSYDKVHGEFYSQLPMSINALLDNNHWRDNLAFDSLSKGSFAQFVTPRTLNQQMTLSKFYVSPDCVDNIFYDSTNEFQVTDKFLVSEYHEVKCLLPMSVMGLPQ